MNNTIALSRIFIKSIINSAYKNNKINIRTVGIIALILFSFLPIVINLIRFATYSYNILADISQEGILLTLGIVTSGLAIFFLGLFYIIGTYYFSTDIETLLPLPVKSYEIVSAKFLVILIYEYITALIILAPILIIYGIQSGAGIIYYVLSLITFLLFPVVPLTLGSIIVMVIMRFSNIAKNKDAFKLIGGIIALGVALGLNIVIQRFMGNAFTDPETLQRLLLEGNNSFVVAYTSIFPGLNFLTYGLINSNTLSGLFNFMVFILITVVLYTLFLVIAEKVYYKGVIGISQVGSKKRNLSENQLKEGSVKRTIIFSYTLKELRLLFRTPIYFLNCVLISFIFPLLLLIPAITQTDGLNALIGFINENSFSVVVALGFAFTMFIASANAVTSTSISREGHNYYVGKYIPVQYGQQILSKVMSGIVLGAIGGITLFFVAITVFKINVYISFITLLISILAVIFASMVGIAIDLFNPKLEWDNEQKAVKQNLNVLFHMLIGGIFAGVTVLIVFNLSLGLWTTIIGLVVSYGVLNILLFKFLMTTGVRLYSQISD